MFGLSLGFGAIFFLSNHILSQIQHERSFQTSSKELKEILLNKDNVILLTCKTQNRNTF